MRDRPSSIEMTLFNGPSLKEEIAQETQDTFEADVSDTEGNFRWYFGFQSSNKTARIPAAHKNQKFQFLANMGLLPDNDILSNKLINIYGKRIFSLIHEKSRTVDSHKSLRKKIGLKLGLSHSKFNANNRMDLHVCWMAVKKIRAIQKIDTLLNTSILDFQRNYQTILNTIKEEIVQLNQLIPPGNQAIYRSERKEIARLLVRVDELANQLHDIKEKDQYHRNHVIQTWERDTFLQLNADFQIHEGRIGLAELSAPIARENISNSVTHTEAQYAIQEHIYSEWNPITPAQLWLTDDETCGNMLRSDPYCTNSLQRKELLLGACISEELAANSPSNSFNCIDQIQEADLVKARTHYQKIKSDLHDASLKAKADDITSFFSSLKRFVLPQNMDEDTGLPLTSREFSRYKRSIQLQLGGKKKLDHTLQNAIESLNNTIQRKEELAKLLSVPTKTESAQETPAPTTQYQHAPLPQRAAPLKDDDGLTGTLDFINNFLLFIDKDLMAKRPYVSMLFFSLPCMQLTFPILATATSAEFFNQIASAIFVVEANLAKYTGLNLFLQATIHQQMTAQNLEAATTAVREAVTWFTCAESMAEQVLIGSLIAKITYNIADLLLNNPFTNRDAALLSEYWTVLFPEASGTLEGTTLPENLKKFFVGFFKTLAQLGAAAVIVGGLEHFIPLMDVLLSPLANVPWDKIASPNFTSLSGLQTLGISKAAAVILLKTYGILEQISAGQLIDIDGHKLRQDSDSFKILVLFLKLAENPTLRFNMDHAAYKIAREHFQELLSHNPALWELYRHQNGTYDNLRDLGVEKIAPKRRHKYPLALVKTIGAFFKMVVGLVPGFLITLPFLLVATAKKISPYALLPEILKPIYRYGAEALNLHIKVVRIAWTLGKAILHPFLAVGARAGEIAVSTILLPFFLAATALRPLGWLLLKKPFHLPTNPVHTFLVKPILSLHADVASWLREYVRYPLEKQFDGILRAGRDLFVRKIERETQVGTVVENPPQMPVEPASENSTFDALKVLAALKSKKPIIPSTSSGEVKNGVIRPHVTLKTAERTPKSALTVPFFTANKASLLLSFPSSQIETLTTLHHSRATVHNHG